jgi:hypothetical protein
MLLCASLPYPPEVLIRGLAENSVLTRLVDISSTVDPEITAVSKAGAAVESVIFALEIFPTHVCALPYSVVHVRVSVLPIVASEFTAYPVALFVPTGSVMLFVY